MSSSIAETCEGFGREAAIEESEKAVQIKKAENLK